MRSKDNVSCRWFGILFDSKKCRWRLSIVDNWFCRFIHKSPFAITYKITVNNHNLCRITNEILNTLFRLLPFCLCFFRFFHAYENVVFWCVYYCLLFCLLKRFERAKYVFCTSFFFGDYYLSKWCDGVAKKVHRSWGFFGPQTQDCFHSCLDRNVRWQLFKDI